MIDAKRKVPRDGLRRCTLVHRILRMVCESLVRLLTTAGKTLHGIKPVTDPSSTRFSFTANPRHIDINPEPSNLTVDPSNPTEVFPPQRLSSHPLIRRRWCPHLIPRQHLSIPPNPLSLIPPPPSWTQPPQLQFHQRTPLSLSLPRFPPKSTRGIRSFLDPALTVEEFDHCADDGEEDRNTDYGERSEDVWLSIVFMVGEIGGRGGGCRCCCSVGMDGCGGHDDCGW